MNSSTTARPLSWTIPMPRRDGRALSGVLRTLALGLAITLVQVCAGGIFRHRSAARSHAGYLQINLPVGRASLARIVHDGYRTTIPPSAAIEFAKSNVAYFPGYPIAGYTIRRCPATGCRLKAVWCSPPNSRLGASGRTGCCSCVASARRDNWPCWQRSRVALHPAGFYLAVAFSESLFLFATFGFFYWLGDPRGRWGWALPHGIVMSATRLGGLPVAYVPVIAQCMTEFAPTAQHCARQLPGERTLEARLRIAGVLIRSRLE